MLTVGGWGWGGGSPTVGEHAVKSVAVPAARDHLLLAGDAVGTLVALDLRTGARVGGYKVAAPRGHGAAAGVSVTHPRGGDPPCRRCRALGARAAA